MTITFRKGMRFLAAFGFIGAGANHFQNLAFYERIIPPGFPSPRALVVISGLAEISGGVGLLIPRLRRPAGIGLIALLIAVFPANIYMAIDPNRSGIGFPRWALWTRLPLQGVMIAWVWFVSLSERDADGASARRKRNEET